MLVFMGLASLMGLASCSFDTPAPTIKPPCTHSYEETIVEATCTTDGYTIYKCKKCGEEKYGNSVQKLGHKVAKLLGKAKTCTTDGLTEGSYCERCGEILVKQEVIPASHEWIYNTEGDSTPATCTTPGVANGMFCRVCREKTEGAVVIPALGHDYKHTKITNSYGGSYTLHKCSRCDDTLADTVVLDYHKNYDYVQFTENPIYEEHRATYKALYETLYEGCMSFFDSTENYVADKTKDYALVYNGNQISVRVTSYEFNDGDISSDEAYAITNSFLGNNPQFYFLSSSMIISTSQTLLGKKHTISVTLAEEYFNYSQRQEAMENIKKMEHEVYDLYLADTTIKEKQKALLIHDYIIEKIDYAWENKSEQIASKEHYAHSIMGVADQNPLTGGVCECYAKTYLYLCKFLGVNTIMVSGIGNGGPHGWNYTNIDGKWYGVDVTWDDQESGKITKFFLASKSVMAEDHTPGNSSPYVNISMDSFQVELPELSTEADY